MREKEMKKYRKSKGLLAILLAVMLSLTMVPAAFANPVDPEGIDRAAITKVLKVPVGTDVPSITFTFTIEGISINDDTTRASSVPVAGNAGQASIVFPGTTANPYQHTENVLPDSTYYYLESAELFGNIVWPDTGRYTYLITENSTQYTLDDGEFLIESQAVYRVVVYVKEDPITKLPYIWGIGAFRITDDGGTDLGPGGVKVDPTPGGPATGEWSYSQMTFGNVYYKHNGDDGEDPEKDTLIISKEVSGEYGSSQTYFDFTLTINKPSLVPDTVTSYRAYILDGTTVVSNLTNNKVGASFITTDSNNVTCIDIPLGTPFTFALKHGQSLVLTNAFVGSNYSISEAATPSYKPFVVVLSNNTLIGEVTAGIGSGLAVPADGTAITSNPLVGELKNSAAFENVNDGIEETGLTMENLPFIGMIALAALGLGAFILIQARKRRAEEL